MKTLFYTILLFAFLAAAAFANTAATATISFSNMSPHLGQRLELRVIDKSTMMEVDRKIVESVTVNFNQPIDNLVVGQSYFIDFYADFNSNGKYDAPPGDHAWRISLDNVQGNDVVNFSHNTNFTDIKWKYLLTINFISMNPHVGQLMELRVENNTTSKEIFRTRIETIPSANFSLNVPGIEIGNEYKIQFYADLNNNKKYDDPPADHTWEINVNDVQGDKSVDFTHNTSFTNLNWKYLATINMLNMTPHVGQLLELRIVDKNSSEEIGRIKLDSILVTNFSVSVPQIEDGHNYNIDFYADFNKNGSYDAPPTDHAWRLEINNSSGNFTTDFTHNTIFTDIQWPPATEVEDEDVIPNEFALKQNYPNPFNPSTSIQYSVGSQSHVVLKVYDVLGNEVTTLVNEVKSPGNYEVKFSAGSGFDGDATKLSSGVYIYKLITNNFTSAKKMILQK